MALSAESQEEEMAYSHDDMMLSTVEEGSEESQLFTQNAPLDEDQCDEDGGSAENISDCEQAAERRSSNTNSDDDGNGGEEDYQEDDQYHTHDEEQASADEVTNRDESQYAQQEGGEGDTAGEEEEEAHHLGEDDQQATDYVGQCHLQLERLRKRKREQEEHIENLVEATFSQIDTLVNTLMRTMQECHAASYNRFEIADAKLAHNLHFHNRMEKKLRMIASILLEESANTQEEA